MQKNVPRYTPDWVRTAPPLVGELAARRGLRAVQRPAHPHLVRQPASGGVSPDPRPRGTPRDPHASRHRHRSARRRRLRRWPRAPRISCGRRSAELGCEGAVKTSGSKGVHVYVPVAGEPSMADAAAATRAIAERTARLDPGIATTAFMKEDRGGKVFIDATRVGWASVISAYSPRVRPGTPVSFPDRLGRPRRRLAARVHHPYGHRAPRRSRPVGRADAAAAGAERGADRGGGRDPRWPRAGDARGQAPRPRSQVEVTPRGTAQRRFVANEGPFRGPQVALPPGSGWNRARRRPRSRERSLSGGRPWTAAVDRAR